MTVYKAPNLIISPKRKVYRRGGGRREALNDEYIYTHTYTLSLPLSLSLSPPTHTHTHITPTHTHTSVIVSGREGHWDAKRCVFRADLKLT